MFDLFPNLPAGAPLRILCLGAHSDDIEIGCGGTLLSLVRRQPAVSIRWVVFSASGERATEARRSAAQFLSGAGAADVHVKEYRDGYFPASGAQIKDDFELLKREFQPDMIFTHYRHDLHQDHRVVSELTWNTFRDHLILEYEVPKYDGDLGQPNTFVVLDEATCARKLQLLAECFPSQQGKQWFDDETFRALLRLRGMEANSLTRYAEAFYCRKAVWQA